METRDHDVPLGVMIDPAVREAAMRRLLAGHPDALVAAVSDDGLFIPLPASLGLDGHPTVQTRSALDLVAPGSRLAVVDMWERARASGSASAGVDLAVEAGQPSRGMAFIFDLTEVHGVHVAVLTAEAAAADGLVEVAELPPPAPRLVRSRKDGLAVISWVGPEVTAMLGWDPADLLGRRALDFIHEDHHDEVIDGWMELLSRPGSAISVRVRHRRADGGWTWVQMANRNLLDDPDCGYVESELLDINDEIEAQEAVRASEQLLRRLAAALPVGVLHLDVDRRVLFANERACEILGAADGDVEAALRTRVRERDRLASAVDVALHGTDVDVEVTVARPDGLRHCTLSLRALTGAGGVASGAVASLDDVTDAAVMQAELERRATVDALTGCVNRATSMTALERALQRPGRGTAAIFIDLDGFKAVNDRFGHAAGDHLLVTIAERLREAVREGDVVGRIGGDEFLVVCPSVPEPSIAMGVAERIALVVAHPVEVDGGLLPVRASIGVACAEAATDADDLIARADAAMYTSKRSGSGRPVLAGASVGSVEGHPNG